MVSNSWRETREHSCRQGGEKRIGERRGEERRKHKDSEKEIISDEWQSSDISVLNLRVKVQIRWEIEVLPLIQSYFSNSVGLIIRFRTPVCHKDDVKRRQN